MLNGTKPTDRQSTATRMPMTVDFSDLDVNIARTRIFLSVVGLLSIYVDPSIGEPFSLEIHMFAILTLHLAYSVGTYLFLRRVPATRRFALG